MFVEPHIHVTWLNKLHDLQSKATFRNICVSGVSAVASTIGSDLYVMNLDVYRSVSVALSIFIRYFKFPALQNWKGLFGGKKTTSGNTSRDVSLEIEVQ
jgi:hypothetical protein